MFRIKSFQDGFSHILIIPVVLLVLGGLSFFVYSRTSDQSMQIFEYLPGDNDCREEAETLLKSKEAKYPLHRCELENYKAEDGSKLTKVRAVAGVVEKQWEFECGFNAACSVHTGWFNEQGSQVDFLSQPQVADSDPAVRALGCARSGSSSIYDTEIKPTLVKHEGQFAWRVEYKSLSTSSDKKEKPNCILNGTSYITAKATSSNLTARYDFDIDKCPYKGGDDSYCYTAKSVMSGKLSDCEYKDGGEQAIDHYCVESFYARTHDESLCNRKTNVDSSIDCKYIQPVYGDLRGTR